MKHCPNCKNDYIDEAKECSDCRMPLVSGDENHIHDDDKIYLTGTEKLLLKVNTENEADVIKHYLEDHDINVLLKYEGIGGYMKIYMGATMNSMIELYVIEEEYDKASRLLLLLNEAEIVLENPFFEEKVEDFKSLDRYLYFRKMAKWILLVSFFGPLAFGLIYSVLTI